MIFHFYSTNSQQGNSILKGGFRPGVKNRIQAAASALPVTPECFCAVTLLSCSWFTHSSASLIPAQHTGRKDSDSSEFQLHSWTPE